MLKSTYTVNVYYDMFKVCAVAVLVVDLCCEWKGMQAVEMKERQWERPWERQWGETDKQLYGRLSFGLAFVVNELVYKSPSTAAETERTPGRNGALLHVSPQ